MSTFKGIVEEFPRISIDYFRQQPGQKAPLACFLSHVHSDHLTGLQPLRAPFVYCSAATREILLRLEKFHYRINYARGILESHSVTYHRHRHKLVKALPLDTPTSIELAPGNNIRVTLIDANHCVGAVMFLIEGDGKAILYTGDIRAENWWVNSLVQNPVLLPYTLGSRSLDCMYLDTTFATKSKIHREFPSKAEGIRELFEKVEAYPDDTIFYFHAWTFGYENVWIALSNFLQSRIHLDDYRARIYGSLSTLDKKSLREGGLDVPSENKSLRESGLEVREATTLCGFLQGNYIQPGCLTSHTNVRIHSCERGMGCPVMENESEARIVHIIPIVSRVDDTDILEVGAGGGQGDLDQKEQFETGDAVSVGKLMELCAKTINEPEPLSKVLALMQGALNDGKTTMNIDLDLQQESQGSESDMSLSKLVAALSSQACKPPEPTRQANKTIRFPYSRHSSYSELCGLLDAFQPKDVFPCTVDESRWDPEVGMKYLFGSYCSEDSFRHDAEMMKMYKERLERDGKRDGESQQETQRTETDIASPIAVKRPKLDNAVTIEEREQESAHFFTPVENLQQVRPPGTPVEDVEVPATSLVQLLSPVVETPVPDPQNAHTLIPDFSPTLLSEKNSLISTSRTSLAMGTTPEEEETEAKEIRRRRQANRQMAYNAVLGKGLSWADYGGLVSTRRKEYMEEYEKEL